MGVHPATRQVVLYGPLPHSQINYYCKHFTLIWEVFTRAAREPAHNNGSGSLPKKKWCMPLTQTEMTPNEFQWLKIAPLFWNDYDNTSEARRAKSV